MRIITATGGVFSTPTVVSCHDSSVLSRYHALTTSAGAAFIYFFVAPSKIEH